jgi:PadR family transcriptional regulator PadR
VEKAGERRRRFYRISAKGRQVLSEQRGTWQEFAAAINQVIGPHHA